MPASLNLRFEMEREKRKKVSPGENGGGVVEESKKRKMKTTETAATTAEEVDEPTTEEVEEFYAILRRMHVARLYLKGAEKRLTERRPAAETAVVRIAEVGKMKELDLNEVPADSAN